MDVETLIDKWALKFAQGINQRVVMELENPTPNKGDYLECVQNFFMDLNELQEDTLNSAMAEVEGE